VTLCKDLGTEYSSQQESKYKCSEMEASLVWMEKKTPTGKYKVSNISLL
jgi:hypothetical protein